MQKQKRDLYLGGEFMADYNSETLAIANSWLDPEVRILLKCGPIQIRIPKHKELIYHFKLFYFAKPISYGMDAPIDQADSATRVQYPVHTDQITFT